MIGVEKMENYDLYREDLVQAFGSCICKSDEGRKRAKILISGDEKAVYFLLNKLDEINDKENNILIKYEENHGEYWVYFPLTQQNRPNKKSRAYKEYIEPMIMNLLNGAFEKWDELKKRDQY